jgi:hypothetical protein
VSRAHTLRKERRLLPIKLSVDPPLRWSILSLTPSLCTLLRYSFVIYSFNLNSMASTRQAARRIFSSAHRSSHPFPTMPISPPAKCRGVDPHAAPLAQSIPVPKNGVEIVPFWDFLPVAAEITPFSEFPTSSNSRAHSIF